MTQTGNSAPVGVVTGMKFEAAILNRWRAAPGAAAPLVEVAGADLALAEIRARSLLDRGAQALVSFGIAGALDTDLKAGTLVLPATVTGSDGATYSTDAGWRTRLTSSLPSSITVSNATIVSVAKAVFSADEKRTLAATACAGAVDMESLAVAAVAEERKTPFIAIRVIADEAARDLPKLIQKAVAPDGSINVTGVVFGILKSPAQITGLIRLGRQNNKAKRTLTRVAHNALPRFALT